MAAAVPYIPLIVSAIGAGASVYAASKTPDTPDTRTAPTPDNEEARRNAERMRQRMSQGSGGRANTILTGSNKLG